MSVSEETDNNSINILIKTPTVARSLYLQFIQEQYIKHTQIF